jgi:hypothetical protein
MAGKVVFVVRDKDSFTTSLYKKVRLANAVIAGLILVAKLYDTLLDIEEKEKSKGE